MAIIDRNNYGFDSDNNTPVDDCVRKSKTTQYELPVTGLIATNIRWDISVDGILTIQRCKPVQRKFAERGISKDSPFPWSPFAQQIKEVHVLTPDLRLENITQPYGLFEGFENCKVFDISNITQINDTNCIKMFKGCKLLESVDLSNMFVFNSSGGFADMTSAFQDCINLKSVKMPVFAHLGVLDSAFKNDKNLESVTFTTSNIEYFDKPYIYLYSAESAFENCVKIESIDIPGTTMDSLANCQKMFFKCENLQSLNTKGWIINGAEYHFKGEKMFTGCNGLTDESVYKNIKVIESKPGGVETRKAISRWNPAAAAAFGVPCERWSPTKEELPSRVLYCSRSDIATPDK